VLGLNCNFLFAVVECSLTGRTEQLPRASMLAGGDSFDARHTRADLDKHCDVFP
jgi:hypothetical protein